MSHLVSAGFFVLRTPALPWDVIQSWCEGLEASSALAGSGDLGGALDRDTRALRERLRDLVRRPAVLAALGHASPSLCARLGPWLQGDETDEALGVEPALVRYVMRMAGRSTPFGLFAGGSVGTVGERTDLVVPPLASHRRHTRIDLDAVFALAEHLAADPAVRHYLRYRANGTIYAAGDRLRFYVVRLNENQRTYPLSDIATTPHIHVALEAARRPTGATIREIAESVVAAFEGVEIDDAVAFVTGLVNVQLLRSSLGPSVTGRDPVRRLVDELRKAPPGAAIADKLDAVLADISEMDATGWEASNDRPGRITRDFASLDERVDTAHLLRVDLRKPCEGLTLGADVVQDLAAAVAVLAATRAEQESPLRRFVRDFEARYQGRQVPLLEAIDAESGIGFGLHLHPGADASPLLEGLDIKAADPDAPWTRRERVLFEKLAQALASGATEIALSPRDIEALSTRPAEPLAPSLNVMAVVASDSRAAFDQGGYRLLLEGVGGVTSGAVLGRFLEDDPALEARVRAVLRSEESHDGDALHAEIAHFPPSRTSNVLCRPVLRDYEIEVVGGSGAADDRKIPLSDLLVSVRAGKVELRSMTHGRRVVPHLSCAHAYQRAGLPAYRFLASLQTQGISSNLAWSWGAALGEAPFLPRVVHGKVVLSLARWRVPGERMTAIAALRGAARFRAVQTLRAELKLPRHVRFVESDNVLPVDLENVLSIESLLSASKRRATITLRETFADAGELVARGAEGAFHHELIVPFVRGAAGAPSAPRLKVVSSTAPTPERARWPGEDWVYLKAYCGVATGDRILADVVAPVIRELRGEGAIARWFFIRYADPGWHLRLRVQGEPGQLWLHAAPRLLAAFARARGLVEKVTLDSYDPEAERYGGDEAMGIAERLFEADSDAALGIVQALRCDASARWKVTLLGMDTLLDALGFSLDEKLRVVTAARDGQMARFASPELTRQLGAKFRALRPELEGLLREPPARYAASIALLERRSRAVAGLAPSLHELEQRGRLLAPRVELAPSYLHMWANRMFRGAANAQELVLYDFLGRIYTGRKARTVSAPAVRCAL